jgi:predicted PurR-regulated permease PerM
VVPESYQGDVRRLMHDLGQIWNAYLRGQIVLCLVMGTAIYLVTLILGLPQPLVLGLIAGFLEFIPNLGPALSMIPAALFALTTDSATIPGLDAGVLYAVIVVAIYIHFQQLEAVFLVPRILGHSLDLHPFVVLIAILMGASLAGVLGVVLAAPMMATLRLGARYLRAKLLDEELFPTEGAYLALPRGFFYRLLRYFLERRFPVLPEDAEASALYDPMNDPVEHSDASGWA